MFARRSLRYWIWPLAGALALGASAGVWGGPGFWWLLALDLLVLAFFLWFFRDPERVIGPHVVSPADGKVLSAEAEEGADRLVIFMSPLDVHVNRAPAEGRIGTVEYHRGGHVPAFNKESVHNERLELELETSQGPMHVKLIAGTVARRIHPYLDAGDEVKKGDRLGLIAFGSRCELVLPSSRFRWLVRPGQWVKAGSTPVAEEVSR